MKIVSFETGGNTSFGIEKNGAIVDLGGRIDGATVAEDLLIPELQAKAAAIAATADGDVATADVTLQIPVTNPEKILCIGVNYANRNAEYNDKTPMPEYPSMFFRVPGSFVGHEAPIVRPPESEQLDYEGEIAIVIGEGGRRIPRETAESHIAALTCLNEGTIRDWLRHGKFNVTQGKNFDRTGSIGPWMVTADEFNGYGDLTVEARVNGDIRQKDTTANLMFNFAYLVSYVSTIMTLKRGDIISTGTPIGAGARFDPPIWLKPGDVLEVEATGIGVLRNEIIDEVV
ncbi:MAG: 2-keto-4-pentenoate hydratase/2-oxohepta-3-ene-1,7-dioic acid hydratase in catechol pathway [Paracoccaceae bacterium]|jgi:2-keto-4-pentenoate hydratase/2-oxohepta-3-ene-1,7-dioic acid hydratase in catechol pathway